MTRSTSMHNLPSTGRAFETAVVADVPDQAAADLRDLMARSASPELYARNAFRVLQLPTSATDREVARRKSTVEKAIAHGLTIPPGAGAALPTPACQDLVEVAAAAHRLSDPRQRIIDELFWFWPASEDDESIAKLRENAVQDAEVAWFEREDTPEDSSIACHNLAVLHHLRALDQEGSVRTAESAEATRAWEKAYRRWAQVLAEPATWDYLANRVRTIGDPRISAQSIREIRAGATGFIAAVTASLALKAMESKKPEQARGLVATLRASTLSQPDVAQGLRQTAAPLQARVSAMCKAATDAAAANPVRADES